MIPQSVVPPDAAVRMRDEVLATVAHDLKTPLSTVIMAAGMLDDMQLDSSQRHHFIEMIRRSAGQITKLIEDLVDVSRIEAGGLRLGLEIEPVGPLLDAVWETFRVQAEQAQLKLDCECARAYRYQVHADRDRLFQVLGNLVNNAIKFTPPGGTIKIRACAIGASVVIAVSDTGRGISPAELPHVFERFWQAGHQQRAGAGLGLAIVKGIIEAHGGRVGVNSTVGRGSTFFFSLPRA
jgi:signal transduction histidine kinase